jgi:hypothetical protein
VALAKDMASVIALLGLPCGGVVQVVTKGENDHLVTCKDGNRYRVTLNAEGRVVCLRGDVAELLTLVEDRHSAASSAPCSGSATPGMGSTSTMPGHGLTMRDSRGKSLRSG